MSLTETTVRNSKPREKPYKLSDEKGLYVEVNPNGAKLWHLKYRFADKEKRLAFGPYLTMTLAMAREQRTEAQRFLRNRVDPGEYKKQAKRAAKVAAANSQRLGNCGLRIHQGSQLSSGRSVFAID
jgi:hypothetical protein